MTPELIALCQQILEDRALTDVEVQQLHDWLHAHPETWKQWPACILIEPVHSALEDGMVREKELHRVASCLMEIEAEWASKQTREIIAEAVLGFNSGVPQLPAVGLQVPIPSASGEETFEVDLSVHECTCNDWQQDRHNHPPGHIGRCCRHVARALLSAAPPRGWPDWLQALLSDCDCRGRGTCPEDQWVILHLAGRSILVSSGKRGWASVYAPAKSGRYQRFGYHWTEHRWSYGIIPPQAPTISKALQEHFAS